MSAFDRVERLVGPDGLARLGKARVILFGVGGVGGWCAEALVRSCIGDITIVDPDVVADSNINRQLPATSSTVGRPKVEVLRERLLDINPQCSVTALQQKYEAGVTWGLEGYDIIIDAIDSLKDKAALILEASAAPGEFFSSMGAACKIDPTRVKVAEFFSVRGCPLGSALRKKIRQAKTLPAKPFLCVYDDEVLPNLGPEQDPGPGKAVANGTLAPITGIFGFTLAALALDAILKDGK
ncbi:MAG: tRNA threonylcarbamoyladenosine dehydratase [Bacteroidales bacterium]|nr:tRNA threonylcarbamoyladenosine dehydratase [Bacteroidales bacterium]